MTQISRSEGELKLRLVFNSVDVPAHQISKLNFSSQTLLCSGQSTKKMSDSPAEQKYQMLVGLQEQFEAEGADRQAEFCERLIGGLESTRD